ncbi:MAG: hypothetical protein WCK65_08605 [Rhodospirillaceae bacterium]
MSNHLTAPQSQSLMAAGVTARLMGAFVVAVGLWLAVAWALDWLG